MKQTTLTVVENARMADGIYRLRLAGDTSAITAPGQFVNLKLSGFFLRRPISVCDWENGKLTLIYKVLGHGTEAMTGMAVGTELDALTGLGNGFDMSRGGEHPLLVGLSAVVKVDTSDTSGRARFDYQSECHCSKTNAYIAWTIRCLTTSQNATAPKLTAYVEITAHSLTTSQNATAPKRFVYQCLTD